MILGPDGKPAAIASQSTRAPVTNWAGSDVFEAARRAGYRGWFYFPTLEPSEMVPTDTRRTIAEKAWWAYNNIDVTRAVIDGLAVEEVDTGIWPKANTTNPHFNREVNEAFDQECGRPDQFHAAEEESFYSMQVLIRRMTRLTGELFGQMLEPGGDPGSLPAIHLIQPWQCTNAATDLDQTKWRDGIMYNRLGRALKFRFVTNKERTSWIDVAREQVLHFHDQFWPGQGRGISALAPITRKLFRLDEIQKAEESGMLLRTRLAYAITKQNNADDGPIVVPGAGEAEVIEQADGTKLIVQKIAAGDTDVDVANMPVGYDFKVVESNRSTQTPDWLRWMLFGMASATGYPAEYVFGLAGFGNGTDVRRVQKRVQRMKNSIRNFQLVKQFVPYWYEFWLWQRVKAGRFDNVQGGIPENFLRHKIIMPADDSVDIAREGRLYDDRMEKGRMSPEQYFGLQETDGDEVEDEIIAMRERRERKLDELNARRRKANPEAPLLTYNDLWPANSNVATAAASSAPDPAPSPAA